MGRGRLVRLLLLLLLALAPRRATGRKGKRAATAAAAGASGWQPAGSEASRELLQQARCDLDVVDAADLTAELFHSDYLGAAKPVLIRGAIRGWRAHRRWRRKSFVKSYGHLRAQTGNATDLVLFNGGWHVHARQRDSIADFVHSFRGSGAAGAAKHELDKPFIFEANQLFGSSPDLRSDFATPAALRPTFNTADEGREGGASPMWSVFSLGEDEAGLPFHSHGAAWLGVVHGGKHWFLYPPGGFDPDDRAMTTPLGGVADWFRRTYPNLAARPIECTQGPGDVLFVPTAWLQ
jgi:hypothetical protein